MSGDYDVAASFLSSLFGEDALDAGWFYLWTNPGKVSMFFRSATDAAEYASEIRDKNVYVGLGLSPTDFGRSSRCKAEDVVGIVGTRVDIDIANGVAHSKGNLPTTLAEARSILDRVPIKPTILVHTGYGLQAHWLFKEPWLLDNDIERQEAATLLKAWNDTIRDHAKAIGGWDVDATHDLARVFRVPGTFNVKDPDNPRRPVTVIEHHDEQRYNPEDFEEFTSLPLADYLVELWKPDGTLDIVLTKTPNVNRRMFECLMSEEPKFKKTWERKRTDLKDQSMSGYDMALACYAALYDWTDQQIADLLLDFRLSKGDEKAAKKAFRLKYLSDTIVNARQLVTREKKGRVAEMEVESRATAMEERNNMPEPQGGQNKSRTSSAPSPSEDGKEEPVKTQKEREDDLKAVSKVLGINVVALRRYEGDDPVFEVDLLVRGRVISVPLGPIENLDSLRNFQKRIGAHALVRIPSKIKRWDSVVSVLLGNVETISTGQETTERGQMLATIISYFHSVKATKDWKGTGVKKFPFTKGGRFYFYLPSLREWMAQRGDRRGPKELGQALARAGCENEIMGGFELADGSPTSRSVYKAPDLVELQSCLKADDSCGF